MEFNKDCEVRVIETRSISNKVVFSRCDIRKIKPRDYEAHGLDWNS